jgi:hypothetical protein
MSNYATLYARLQQMQAGRVDLLTVLILVIVVVAIFRLINRIRRDGWTRLFETEEQRWQRRESERMKNWAQRDNQRQRFAMVLRRTEQPLSGSDGSTEPD